MPSYTECCREESLGFLKATEQLDNNKAEKQPLHWETARLISHLTLVACFSRGYSRLRRKRKNTSEEWNNNKPISTHQRRRAHPPEFTGFAPTPNPIHPSPRAKACFWRCLEWRPPQSPQNYALGHRIGYQCQMLSTHSYPDRTFLIRTSQWKSRQWKSLTCANESQGIIQRQGAWLFLF